MPVFLTEKTLSPGEQFSLSPTDLNHLRRSLRVGIGGTFSVLFPNGHKATAKLFKEGTRFLGKIEKVSQAPGATSLPIWIGIASIRWNRLEWFSEKATEMGATRISLINTERSRFTKDKYLNKLNRLELKIKETLKQCERPQGPRLDPPQELASWLKNLEANPDDPWQRVLFDEEVEGPLWSPSKIPLAKAYLLMIGPEGGWDPKEIKMLREAGFTSYSLGAARLRSETAALYGLATIDFLLKEKKGTP